MKDYYNLFIQFCLQQCTKEGYADIQKVKTHNAASKALQQLQAEMQETDSKEILRKLLSHQDERVKINAASLCLQMHILVEEAVRALQNIIDFSDDATIRFSAKMLLQDIY